jgi:hypothetical protein
MEKFFKFPRKILNQKRNTKLRKNNMFIMPSKFNDNVTEIVILKKVKK